MKKLFYILGILFLSALMMGGFRVYNNIVATGDITANGMVHQGNTRHMFGGFQLQSTTINVTQNVWTGITNPTNTLWTGLEANGMLLSGDKMTITNTGDYMGTVTVAVSAPNNVDICIRLYNITQAQVAGYQICGTPGSVNNFMPLTLPLYIEDDSGDVFEMQITNITNNDDPIVRSAVFYMSYLHD